MAGCGWAVSRVVVSTHVILVNMAEVVKEWFPEKQEDVIISKNKIK